MAISYKKLWHKLIDMDMNKTDLQKSANLSWASISKLNKGENIGTDILLRICNALDCDTSDIMEVVREPEESNAANVPKKGQ